MKYKIKLSIVLTMFIQQTLLADTIRFKGEFYDFKLQTEGKFEIIEKESEVNSMLEAFLSDKKDFDKMIKYYDAESIVKIKELVKTPEGMKGFMDRLGFVNTIRVRATIQERGETRALLHINEGDVGSLMMFSEIAFIDKKPYLRYVDLTFSAADSYDYWLLQIWNTFQSAEPTIVK